MLAVVTMLLLALDGCLVEASLSLTLWSYKGSQSLVRHFTLRSTQTCYKLSYCVLGNVSFAQWSTLPSGNRVGFFQDDSCHLLSFFATKDEDRSLAFDKVWISENVSSVMVYDHVSTSVEYSTDCSSLYN